MTPRTVYETIVQGCQSCLSDRQSRLTIVFDKLTLLSSLGFSIRDTVALVRCLQAFSLETGSTLVTLSRGHSSRDLDLRYSDLDDLDDDNDRLVAYLDQTSHLTVVVWPLATGHSEVVSGNLMFSWNDLEVGGCGGDKGRFQYNTEDKNVRVFALGASRAVL